MINKKYKRFYWLTLAVLLVLSAYPLINGIRMAYLSILNGAIRPEQYAKYNIFGCYEFGECLYMNPLSSFMPANGFMPYIYELGEETLIIANTETGDMLRLSALYENTAVAGDEFSSKSSFTYFSLPDVSRYKERWLRAVFTDEGGQQYSLYQMDGEIWLVKLSRGDIGIWSIYRLQRTDKSTH